MNDLEQDILRDESFYQSYDGSPRYVGNNFSLYDEINGFEGDHSPMDFNVRNEHSNDPMVTDVKMDNKKLQTQLYEKTRQNGMLQDEYITIEQRLENLTDI